MCDGAHERYPNGIGDREQPRRRPLTADELKRVDALLNCPDDRLVIDAFSIEITTAKLSCLRGLSWLNDEVLNFYFELLNARAQSAVLNLSLPPERRRRIWYLNTFFYAKLAEGGVYRYANVKRWSKRQKVDTAALDKIIIPVHVHGNHWCVLSRRPD
jgi:sentrin-specific protease 1